MNLLPKWTQTVSKKISAQGNIRPTLAGVYITPTHCMATDSFKAVKLKLSTEENKTGDISAFPKMENEKPLELKEGEKLFIHRDVMDDVKFKFYKNADVISNKALLLDSEDGKTYGIRVDDLITKTTYSAKRNDGTFPDIDKITNDILSNPPKDRVGVNIDYLIDILQTLKDRGSRNCIIESRELQGVIITPDDVQDYDSYAILMPLKI